MAVPQGVSKLINSKEGEKLFYLYERWQDEKEYEDFADYEKVMRGMILDGMAFVKATKSPFGFRCIIDNRSCHIFIKASTRHLQLCASCTK